MALAVSCQSLVMVTDDILHSLSQFIARTVMFTPCATRAYDVSTLGTAPASTTSNQWWQDVAVTDGRFTGITRRRL